jgi:hypothetical protein
MEKEKDEDEQDEDDAEHKYGKRKLTIYVHSMWAT